MVVPRWSSWIGSVHGMCVHAGSQPQHRAPYLPRNKGSLLPVLIPPWEWGTVDPRCILRTHSPCLFPSALELALEHWERLGGRWETSPRLPVVELREGVIPESLLQDVQGKGVGEAPLCISLLGEFLSFIQNLTPAVL